MPSWLISCLFRWVPVWIRLGISPLRALEFLRNSLTQTNQTKQTKQMFIRLYYLDYWIQIMQLIWWTKLKFNKMYYSPNNTVWWTSVLFDCCLYRQLCDHFGAVGQIWHWWSLFQICGTNPRESSKEVPKTNSSCIHTHNYKYQFSIDIWVSRLYTVNKVRYIANY